MKGLSLAAAQRTEKLRDLQRRASRRLRSERGQLFVIVVFMLAGLFGMTALVLDVGAWMREQRRLQAVADAAALAGAQALPYDPSTATSLALSYASKNGGPSPAITFPAANTIDVSVEDRALGFFAKVYGVAFDQVDVRAHAAARAQNPSRAAGVVPIVVANTQPMLSGCNGPCFGSATTLKVNDDTTLGGGQMGLIDLTGNGSVTAGQIADWVSNGLDADMEPNRYYYAAGSCKFSNQNFHYALDAKVASQQALLFPVYDPVRTNTSTNPPQYWIVGWAAFVVTDYRLNGCDNKNDFIAGSFVRFIARGVADVSSTTPDFGAYVISLVG